MKPIPSSVRRVLIRISYLLPAITGICLLVYACIPHLFFSYGEAFYNTLSIFNLLGNTWEECSAIIDGVTEGSQDALLFAFIMNFFVILSWVAIVLFCVVAISAAICSCIAFSYSPTERQTNRAKRWMMFFCPNRVLYVSANLLPLIPAAFAHILLAAYQKLLLYDMSLFFIGPSDLLLAGILVALTLLSFFCLLPAQASEHMDMFRLYKAKKER